MLLVFLFFLLHLDDIEPRCTCHTVHDRQANAVLRPAFTEYPCNAIRIRLPKGGKDCMCCSPCIRTQICSLSCSIQCQMI